MKFDDDYHDKHGLLSKSAYKKIQGVVPKDVEAKKEIMSFIAYPPNLEFACKLLS